MANALDRKQNELRERQQQDRDAQRQADLHELVSHPVGRRFFVWLFAELEPEQIWNPNAAIAGYNASRADIAKWLRSEIDQVDPDANVTMLVEARQQARQEQRERDALDRRRSRRTESEPGNENEPGEDQEDHIDG